MQINIGDFVTTCEAGFWQLIDLKPKIADSDCIFEGLSWKKGDIIGEWAILKKAFTPKMKPRIDFSYVDASLLNPVSEEIKKEIMTYFSVHPEFKLKFDAACMKLRPMITNCWIDLSEDQETILKNVLANLPSEFTMDEFWSMMKEFDICISKPPVSHLLNFLTYPWNMDSDANLKYFGVELIKL